MPITMRCKNKGEQKIWADLKRRELWSNHSPFRLLRIIMRCILFRLPRQVSWRQNLTCNLLKRSKLIKYRIQKIKKCQNRPRNLLIRKFHPRHSSAEIKEMALFTSRLINSSSIFWMGLTSTTTRSTLKIQSKWYSRTTKRSLSILTRLRLPTNWSSQYYITCEKLELWQWKTSFSWTHQKVNLPEAIPSEYLT